MSEESQEDGYGGTEYLCACIVHVQLHIWKWGKERGGVYTMRKSGNISQKWGGVLVHAFVPLPAWYIF